MEDQAQDSGLELSQGSEQSPSLDESINAHLDGGQQAENEVIETPEIEQQPEEPKGRAEERIQELVRKAEEAERRAFELETFIVSNPTARAAYEEAINQGATPEQAAQHAAGQQQEVQSGKWYGEVMDRSQLPDWDPYDETVVFEHAKPLIHDMLKDMLAPYAQQLQSIAPFVQDQRTQLEQAERAQLHQTLDELVYSEMPEIKDNKLYQTVAAQSILEGVQGLPPEYQEAIKNFSQQPPHNKALVKQALEMVAKQAAIKTKELVGFQPQQQAAPKLFSEGGTNLVAPRPNEPKTLDEMILAHINK